MDRQLLARATENSDAPTPGYMYLDIAKNAATNPSTCADVAKYLAGRLASKNNHNIKYKCLKVMSKTCTSPYLKGQFKRCLAQDPQAMAAIKEALQFRGPPDPARGDEPYERVRTAAKEALDAVYSDSPNEGSGGAPFATSVSSSYGPSAHQQGGGGGHDGSRRMEGIGNPMFSDPRLEPQPATIGNMTINDVVKEAKQTVIGIIKDPLARNAGVPAGNHSGSMPRPGGSYGGPAGGFSGPPPGRNELVNQTGGQWTMASNRGPDAVGAPPNYSNDSAYYKSRDTGNAYAWAQQGSAAAGGVGGSWASGAPGGVAGQAREPPYQHQATPSIAVTGGVVPQTTGGGGTAVADGSYEKQLVQELCPPGGMKPEPPPDKLAQFSRSVANLNADFVSPVLLDCLEEGQPWIIRAKALWVIEACIKHGKKPGSSTNAYADFFHACSGEIAPLANHARGAIKDPAKRVLALIGVATPVGGAPPVAAPPAAAAPAAPVPNLLDFDDAAPASTAAPPPVPTQPAPAPPAPAANQSALFGGLNVAAPAPAATPPNPPPAAAPQPPAASESLLGDLTDNQAAPASNGGTLFGDMKVKATPAPEPTPVDPTVAQTSALFDEKVSLKTEEAPASEEAAMPSGSAFGFINQTASGDAGDKQADAASGIQSMDSFDPLKNVTPNTAKAMMQVSPEQMQAAHYQQLLLQQQMQMAQMQMALNQQRGGALAGMYPPGAGAANVLQNPAAANVMQNPAAAKTSFAFMEKPPEKTDKSFDFVKDAMTKEKKK